MRRFIPGRFPRRPVVFGAYLWRQDLRGEYTGLRGSGAAAVADFFSGLEENDSRVALYLFVRRASMARDLNGEIAIDDRPATSHVIHGAHPHHIRGAAAQTLLMDALALASALFVL